MNLQLSIAMADNPRTRPILEQKVKPDGIDLICTRLHASELFWRQLRFGDFDVSEMSLSSLMMAVAGGDDRFVGIPVFSTRRMFQVGVLVRNDRGIDKPDDLKGKKMGVPEYQQTAALWTRGYLQHEYGIHPRDMEFWMERNDDGEPGPAMEHPGSHPSGQQDHRMVGRHQMAQAAVTGAAGEPAFAVAPAARSISGLQI